jgi:predicted DsbA family dithiol-disulfide isomerase
VPADDFFREKFGSAQRTQPIFTRVSAEGEKEGLELRFDRMQRAPNTRLAHRLVSLAHREDQGLAALDALFAAHFRDGVDVADPDAALTAVRDATGLDLAAGLEAGEGEEQVAEDEGLAAAIGITGVPCFVVLDANTGLSGAHEPALLRKLIAAAREKATA